ncbi:MAG: hypothetical protein A2512_07010 [Deltaproteobacteria bacterium RIFOXYD12_FULL_56_24]|nr:MAG: hypothetical protein A2512_07010 [Deltaproteobacteria bacterium RIFOXYD12_FULL_56_24]
MDSPLHVLLVEDSEDDAALLDRALRKGGYTPLLTRVETAEALCRCLGNADDWHLVLSDYSMPRFNGLEALKLVRQTRPDLPFILVSGAIGEEAATEIVRAGARDYVMKDKLGRLPLVVARELEEAEHRKAQRQADRAMTALVGGIVGTTGTECFDRIITGLCELLDADSGFIGFLEEGGKRLRMLACFINRVKTQTFSYDLTPNVPCSMVVADGYQLYPQGVRDVFIGNRLLEDLGAEGYVGIPLFNIERQPMGTFCVVSSRPLRPPTNLQKIMEIMAVKVAAEIERLMAEQEREKLESQLRQAQKMEAIGTLAGGIAHDFNNILTPIIGYTEIARMGMSEEEKKLWGVEEVLKAASRARDLVRQILAFSRHREQEYISLSLQPIIRESIKLLRASLPATLEIRLDIDQNCGPVFADPTQIHQVIMNLSTNAAHAMEDAGGILEVDLQEVDVRAEQFPDEPLAPGRYACLTVRDTGKGMDRATLERIFEPYFTTKAQGKGTGLGLSVVHGIISAFHGRIDVTSEKGQGTIFKIHLPITPPAKTGNDPAAAENQTTDLPCGNERLLLVDDEESIVAMNVTMLERLGYRVTGMTNGGKALALFAENPRGFDLVITDQTMPGMTGGELVGRMQEIRPDIPVILCTGYSAQMTEERALAIGIRAYLMKPLNLHELALAIRRAIATPKTG